MTGDSLTGASMQSLPPRPVAVPPSLSSIQHSPSLNDTFMRALPRLVLQRPAPPRLGPCCPLGPPDSFASSPRELEKCGWYWGPMKWGGRKGKPDGSFLVRDSSDLKYILSLSFKSMKVFPRPRSSSCIRSRGSAALKLFCIRQLVRTDHIQELPMPTPLISSLRRRLARP